MSRPFLQNLSRAIFCVMGVNFQFLSRAIQSVSRAFLDSKIVTGEIWASAIPFLVMKVSFGSLGVDFEVKNVDFGALRVNHSWHRGVDFRSPGSRFLATEGYFGHPAVC